MIIGIDISQVAYSGTGVSNYLKSLVGNLIKTDTENNYILFFSSFRNKFNISDLGLNTLPKNVKVKEFKIPPTFLGLVWNKLHIFPIENFVGKVDLFITSDWTEPPAKHARKATFLYDLLVYKYPQEMHNKTEVNPLKLLISPNIVSMQKRKLEWVKRETDLIFCISKATLIDAKNILEINESKLKVAYPGF